MSDLVQSLLAAFGGSVTAVLAVGWLAKKWILHRLTKALESHKLRLTAELESVNRRALVELEAALRISEARVSKLHERRFEVLEALHQKMVDVFRDAGAFLSLAEFHGEPTKVELRKKLGASLREFLTFYRYHKIFFSRDVAVKVDELLKSIREPALQFSLFLSTAADDDRAQDSMIENWLAAHEAFEKLAGPALDAVQEEFRSLLGVSEGNLC